MKKIIVALIALLLVGTVFALSPFNSLYRSTTSNKLCHKEAPDWTCQSHSQGYGMVKYKLADPNGFNMKMLFTSRSLKPNTWYQAKLNSYGPGNEADAFAAACDAPNTHVDCEGTPCYKCGTWGDEGFVVVALAKTDSRGRLHIYRPTTLNLPEGIYRDVKFLIAENGGDWETPLMEREALNFLVLN